MFKKFAHLLIIIILLPAICWGQSLSLSTITGTAGNNPSTFTLDGGKISLTNNKLEFLNGETLINGVEAVAISSDKSLVGTFDVDAEEEEIKLYDALGNALLSYPSTISLTEDDPSWAMYVWNKGSVLLRDKISNFTFYDTFGNLDFSFSNSSQSKEGESISEVAFSRDGSTIVVYNPKIKRGSNLGSKASVMLSDGSFENMFGSGKRYLKNVTISDSGDIIVAITAQSGTNDQVLIFDKYGEQLNTISVKDDLEDVSITDNSNYLALYSSGRVMVYNTFSGNRIGSTSSRSSIIMADYYEEDDIILLVTGNHSESSGTANNVSFRAINIAKRAIASKDYSSPIGIRSEFRPHLVRTAPNTYELRNTSREIRVTANF